MELLSGRYRLIERVGAGGMSVVWRAYDEVLRRQVAVKVLSPELAGDERLRDQIRREAQAAAGLSDPHITSVFDYGEAAGPGGTVLPYVVMELVDGQPLASRLAAGPLHWSLALRVGAQVASALATAHARGLVHRDISPANIMLTEAGVKVVDFGIAAAIGERADPIPYGTPAYLAPERRAGDPGSPASDVYAVGVVVYQVLTGHLPWPGELPEPGQPYPLPTPLPAITGLPQRAYPLIEGCLADDPAARPDCRQLGVELGELVGSSPRPSPGVPVVPIPAPAGRAAVVGRTTALPIRSGTRVMPVYQPAPGRRRILPGLAVFTALVLVALLGVAMATASTNHPGAAPSQPVAPSPTRVRPNPTLTLAGGLACQVAVSSAVRAFGPLAVQLKVTNTGAQPFQDWTLQFRVPEHERVSVTTGRISQHGRQVTVTQFFDRGQLQPGDSFSVSYLGSDSHDNQVSPDQFVLGGVACDAPD